MWVESEPGRGSAFHFTAPVGLQDPGDVPSNAARTGARRVARSGSGRQFDEPPLPSRRCSRVGDAAQFGGRRPARSGGADECRRGGEPYPLVLLDVTMPEMDGFDLARQIECARRCRGVRDVAVLQRRPGDARSRPASWACPLPVETAVAMGSPAGHAAAPGKAEAIRRLANGRDAPCRCTAAACCSRTTVR